MLLKFIIFVLVPYERGTFLSLPILIHFLFKVGGDVNVLTLIQIIFRTQT